MPDPSTYTIGVFQDAAWAERGVRALLEDGFAPDSITVVASESPATAKLIQTLFDEPPQLLEVKGLGRTLAVGPLLATLQGTDGQLAASGLATIIGRAGFQAHDGYIYQALVSRGGVLVAVRDLARAADALARLHAYGGGNAAIGAWAGRV